MSTVVQVRSRSNASPSGTLGRVASDNALCLGARTSRSDGVERPGFEARRSTRWAKPRSPLGATRGLDGFMFSLPIKEAGGSGSMVLFSTSV